MSLAAKKNKQKFTYQDYLTWDDDERYEIIDGVVYNMSPAPGTKHQIVSGNLFTQIKNHISKKGNCRVFAAPTDVILSDDTVVQPDIFVVCDEKIITDKNINGIPDLVIEIISPSTAIKDITIKKKKYAEVGVKEFLIVHPVEFYVEQFVLSNNGYTLNKAYGDQEVLEFKIFKEAKIALWEIFEVEKRDMNKVREPKVVYTVPPKELIEKALKKS